MQLAEPIATVASKRWASRLPRASVVVSTHGRADLLTGLLRCFDATAAVDAEFVIADNGSADSTWDVLTEWCATTLLPAHAMRLPFHDGPGVPRNTAVAAAHGDVIAFTDDDCLPTPRWLPELIAPFADMAVAIVQGRTTPEPGVWAGPWSRTLEITKPSGLYETANLGCRRVAFEEVGGFASDRLLTGRAFGEDVQLGTAIARRGEFRFADNALLHHRRLPNTYRGYLAERARLAGFPALVGEVPELRERLIGGVFLSRRTITTDVAAVAVAAATVTSPLPLVLTVPWLANCWQASAGRPGRPRVVRAAQVAAGDLVALGALVKGSAAARTVVL